MQQESQRPLPAVEVNQIELIAAIVTHLERRHGARRVLPRQLNAVVNAANMIVDEFSIAEKTVQPGMGFTAWCHTDQTGESSLFMARALRGEVARNYSFPQDPDDFGRCLGLLDACPELREKLSLMSEQGPEWAALVDDWDELEAVYNEEKPSGKFPRTYERMIAGRI